MCTRVLPDEAAHSQYEMRSFVRSDSGMLYPTGQGRLADPSNPVLSNTVANFTSLVSITGTVPGIAPKPGLPKPVKEKPKSRPSAGKVSRTPVGHLVPTPATHQDESVVNLSRSSSADRLTVGSVKEDQKARQTRLNAYDDAIESVLRRVQETEDDVIYDQIASDFGNEEEPFVPPAVAAGRSLDRDERQAQIADTIDAVIARTFHDSDQSQSPPMPVGSPPPYDDEDEIIEVHSVSPLKVEVTTDDVLILPPPSPQPASPVPSQTLAEKKFIAEEELGVSTSKRTKKPRKGPAVSVAEVYDKDGDFGWSSGRAKSPSPPEITSRLKFGIPDSYVQLEEMPSARKGREDKFDEDDESVGVDQPLPLDAAESLIKLACVAPPPKRLKISYGSGRERMVDDTRDNSEDREIYEPKMTSALKPGLGMDDLSHYDVEERSQRSSASDLLTLERGQKSTRDERAKVRGREVTREKAKLHNVSTDVVEPLHEKPPAKKGRSRKDQKKRGDQTQKAVVITLDGFVCPYIFLLTLFRSAWNASAD